MSSPMHQMFRSMTDFFEYSQQIANGSESFAKIDIDDVEIGTAKKTQISQIDKVRLFHYESPEKVEINTDPVLIVYGLIGSYSMIDLQEDRSLVRNLLARGVDLYVIDWGHPTRADQFLSFDDYVCFYLSSFVDDICERHAIDDINLFGVCEGGVFSTMYAARYREKVRNLLISITPIDFIADKQDDDPSHGLINLWTRNLNTQDIESLVDAYGCLPGDVMGAVFNALTPIRSMTKYNLDLAQLSSNPDKLLNFLRMEKWLSDRPNHPGIAAKQWLINLYQQNQLVKSEFILDGEVVDLSEITMPVLNVYAEKDHIVPPPCSTALAKYVKSNDYSEMPLNAGHVGIYVSSKLQNEVSSQIYDWLSTRQ